jgi:hypothetical protein
MYLRIGQQSRIKKTMRKLFSGSNTAKILLALFGLVCIIQGSYTWFDYAYVQLYKTAKYGLISSIQKSGIFLLTIIQQQIFGGWTTIFPKTSPLSFFQGREIGYPIKI